MSNKQFGTAPRVTADVVDAECVAHSYHVFAERHTVCCITMQNGFTVIGESACVSKENFNEALGRQIARNKARDKVWELLAFRLADRLALAKTMGGES